MTIAKTHKPVNAPQQVLFASLIGTTIEFFDFYIYATAAVLVFPACFSRVRSRSARSPPWRPLESPSSRARRLRALRPLWRPHRPQNDACHRAVTMGLSTVAIGALPVYAQSALPRRCCWHSAVLAKDWAWAASGAEPCSSRSRTHLQTSAPGTECFPQLGAPVGFFLLRRHLPFLSRWLTDKQFFAFGWRLPFLASAVLVFLGLYVRLTITETPVFRESVNRREQVKIPMWSVLRHHARSLVAGILVCLATFVLFYLMTVFALSWGTSALGYSRGKFLLMQLFCVSLFALTIPVSALLAEHGRRRVMIWITLSIGLFGLVLAPLFMAGTVGATAMMALGLALMGLTYGPLGTVISELFPTPVRYTGSSLAFSVAGILGASLAPYIATWLAKTYGLQYVGYYLCASAALTLLGLFSIRETKDDDLAGSTVWVQDLPEM